MNESEVKELARDITRRIILREAEDMALNMSNQLMKTAKCIFNIVEDPLSSGRYLTRGRAATPTGKEFLAEHEVPGGVGGTWVTNDIEYAKEYGEPLSFVASPDRVLSTKDFEVQLGKRLEDVSWTDMKSLAQRKGFDAIRFEPGAISSRTEVWIFKRPKLLSLEDVLWTECVLTQMPAERR